MLYAIMSLIGLAATLMPDTFWPEVLAITAGGFAVASLYGMANYSRVVSEAALAKVYVPGMARHYLMWLPVLALASLVHWFPTVCLLFTFAIEACIYADLRELQP